MPDWKPEIRRRLADLSLAPMRETAIVEELAQHLDDCYEELLAGSATEDEATRTALAELSESNALRQELRRVERQITQEPIVPGTNRRTNTLADLWQDLKYAMRMMRKARRILLDQSRVDAGRPSIPLFGPIAGHPVLLSNINILLDDNQ